MTIKGTARLVLRHTKDLDDSDLVRVLAREAIEQDSELEKYLRKLIDCKAECSRCEGAGIEPETDNDACSCCGGYGFNVGGDIRQLVVDVEECFK